MSSIQASRIFSRIKCTGPLLIYFIFHSYYSYSQEPIKIQNKPLTQTMAYLPGEQMLKQFHINLQTSVDSGTFGDSLIIKKRFWRAAGELMLVQLVPFCYNKYVRDAEFANISWESIGYNLKFSNWEWDDNSFTTNQFAHPYHGNLYFSAFRTNGYSFWQSVPAAWAGSYMWEVAGETHPPAPNDLINTSLGGISLGEMTYRFSNLIVNNRQVGFKRQMNEVLAFLVNPLNGLNRIIDGRWGRVMPNLPDRVPAFLNGNLDVGYRRFSHNKNDVFTKGDNEFYIRAGIQYGDPFDDLDKPFSNFSLNGELGASDSATLNNVQVNGFLFGNETRSDDKARSVFCVTMNYDYIRNNVIQYGGQSFNVKLMKDWIKKNNSNIFGEAGVVLVALGSVPDDYLSYGEGRNYDFGPGAGLLAGTKLNIHDKFWFSINYKGVWFTTMNGNDADFFLHVLTSELRYYFTNSFSATAQLGYFEQDSYYADYENVYHEYPFGRIGIGYTIGEKLRH
jgi:hypothetical protein